MGDDVVADQNRGVILDLCMCTIARKITRRKARQRACQAFQVCRGMPFQARVCVVALAEKTSVNTARDSSQNRSREQ